MLLLRQMRNEEPLPGAPSRSRSSVSRFFVTSVSRMAFSPGSDELVGERAGTSSQIGEVRRKLEGDHARQHNPPG